MVMENMMSNQDKYNKLLKLQKEYRLGIVKDEDLTLKEKVLLNKLYDMQLQKLEEENKKKLNKILKYKNKISC